MADLDIWLIVTIFVKTLLYASSFITVGSTLFLLIFKPQDVTLEKALLRWITLGALSALIITVFQFSLQAGQLLDDGLSGMTDHEMLILVSETPLGHSSFLRALAVLIVYLGILIPTLRLLFSMLGSALIILSFVLVGHATDASVFLNLVIFLHLTAISYWFGALMPLYHLVSDEKTWSMAGDYAGRFGQQASFIVPILIVAGVLFAYSLLGSFQAVFTSAYGQVLLVKVAVVGVLLTLATFNKLRFVPALMRREKAGIKHLRTSIRWEAFVFLIVFLITAVLTSAVMLPEAHH